MLLGPVLVLVSPGQKGIVTRDGCNEEGQHLFHNACRICQEKDGQTVDEMNEMGPPSDVVSLVYKP